MLTGDRELELIPTRTGFVPGMTSVKTSSGTKTKVGARTPSRGQSSAMAIQYKYMNGFSQILTLTLGEQILDPKVEVKIHPAVLLPTSRFGRDGGDPGW